MGEPLVGYDAQRMDRKGMRTWLGLVAGAAVCLLPHVSFADDAAAARDFEEGLRQMLAGEFDSGCLRLRTSYEADPRPGVLFTLAECYAKAGRGDEALRRYTEYLGLYSRLSVEQRRAQAERAKIAEAQCDALSRTVKVEGESSPGGSGTPTPAPSPSPAPTAQAETSRPSASLVPWAIGTSAAAGALLAASGVTFALAESQRGIADLACTRAGSCVSAAGVHAGELSRSYANVTTGLLVASGAFAGIAVTLWTLRANERSVVSVQVAPGLFGAALRGAF